MTKMKLLLIWLMLIPYLSVIGGAQSKSSSPSVKNMRLGPVSEKTLSETREFPGCILFRTLDDEAKGRIIFVSDLSGSLGGDAFINLDGKDIKLELIKIGGNTDLKVGARSWKIYTAGDITLQCDFILTKVCSPPKDDCELFSLDDAFLSRLTTDR